MQDTSTHQASHDAAHSVLPSLNTNSTQSPDCALLKEQYRSLTSHARIQYKVALQLKPIQTPAPHTHRHGYSFPPTCSPRLLRMLDSSMVQSPDLTCLPTGAKPRCTAWLLPPAPPSLRLNLILAAAKHFHQKLSDWRGAVSWHLLLFLYSVTSRVKERDGARERERGGGEWERREKIGRSNLAQQRAGVRGWVGEGLLETSGSPKTHFSEQPRFLGTLGDHENERISFPALFCLYFNNEFGILSAAGRQNPHWSYCSQWSLDRWRKHDGWDYSWH